ncbi:MAG: cysteine--tRNA ligase, partial [Polyangia bacterium]|nr:cysteine--tRNA ligase [Polyangia bacterium]
EVRFPDLEESERRLSYFYDTLQRLEDLLGGAKEPGPGPVVEGVAAAGGAFDEAMDDDFNTAAVLAPVGDLFKLANRLLEDPRSAPKADRMRSLFRLRAEIRRVGETLGFWQEAPEAYLGRTRVALAARRGVDPGWVEERIQARAGARQGKDFASADAIRSELAAKGVELMDSPKGTRWRLVE